MSNEKPIIQMSLNHLWGFITSIVVPLIGLIITGVIFATNLMNKVDGITMKVTEISNRQDKADDKLDHVSTRLDTIERRQAIYQAVHK